MIEKAKGNRFFNTVSPILFIDEIHRFSKSQQDSLLNAVETGVVTLIGATTENPSFEVIRPLLSRCQVYVLKSLEKADLLTLLNKAVTEDIILKDMNIVLAETDAMLRYSGGDARKLLNILELVVAAEEGNEKIEITDEKVVERLQENPAAYDKGGEMHYDIISAFIKSIRGSDPDAAVYWLARMVAGGEDPEFIARRLVISASEDIGLANPNALLLANACFDALKKIGWPEGRIILAETTVYLACSPKSNSAYMAINDALELVNRTGNLPVPLHLRNAPTKLMAELNYGKDYKYAHDYENHFVKDKADMMSLPSFVALNFLRAICSSITVSSSTAPSRDDSAVRRTRASLAASVSANIFISSNLPVTAQQGQQIGFLNVQTRAAPAAEADGLRRGFSVVIFFT